MADDFIRDITIPVIEITDGWTVDELETREDCEDAQIKINSIIAEIEFQIDMFDALPAEKQDLAWLARAKRALKYRKIAAACVNNAMGRLSRIEREQRKDLEDRVFRLEQIIQAHAKASAA